MKRVINIHPGTVSKVLLGMLPFILTLLLYLWVSEIRLEQNPSDKLMPSFGKMSAAVERMALQPSKRTGEYLFWSDTLASLQRLSIGVIIAASLGMLVGLLSGSIPLIRAKLSPYVTILSLIPPMAILPILFIIFGLGELSKVMLIVIGITPFIIRDLQSRTLELPQEQLIKAQTLGASSWQVLLRVVIPQMLPRLLQAVRLSFGPAWLFLIAAEAIAAEQGLGYRIFLVRRYLSMDVILPYVAWITFLAFMADWALRASSQRFFPWFHQQTAGKTP